MRDAPAHRSGQLLSSLRSTKHARFDVFGFMHIGTIAMATPCEEQLWLMSWKRERLI